MIATTTRLPLTDAAALLLLGELAAIAHLFAPRPSAMTTGTPAA